MANSIRYEQRSMLEAVEDYLVTAGWNNLTYTDGFQPEGTIIPPHIAVIFSPSTTKSLQLGKIKGKDKLYSRSIVINAYMENEGRASDIMGVIMEFIEFACVEIKNHENTVLGTMICNDDDAILGQVFEPIMHDPQNIRWRGAVSAPFESFYPG